MSTRRRWPRAGGCGRRPGTDLGPPAPRPPSSSENHGARTGSHPRSGIQLPPPSAPGSGHGKIPLPYAVVRAHPARDPRAPVSLVPEPAGHAHGPRPCHRHDDQIEAVVRGVRDRVLVRAQDALEAMPENPRDGEGRVLCPICKRPPARVARSCTTVIAGGREAAPRTTPREGRPERSSDDRLSHVEESGPAYLASMLHVDHSIGRDDVAHRGNLLA
jgi:hypothetical protein